MKQQYPWLILLAGGTHYVCSRATSVSVTPTDLLGVRISPGGTTFLAAHYQISVELSELWLLPGNQVHEWARTGVLPSDAVSVDLWSFRSFLGQRFGMIIGISDGLNRRAWLMSDEPGVLRDIGYDFDPNDPQGILRSLDLAFDGLLLNVDDNAAD